MNEVTHMNKQHRELSVMVLSAALTASAWGCSTAEPPAPQHAPGTSATAAAADPPPVATAAQAAQTAPPAASALEASAIAGVEVPFVLTLETPDKVPTKGVVHIAAQIKAGAALAVPTTITIELPAGAKLKSGKAREKLASLPAGLTKRAFEVTLAEPLTATAPIKIRVDAVDPGGAFGAHSDRSYPEAAKVNKAGASRVPPPPVGRPGHGAGAKRAVSP